jgi:hypothetical protein
MLHASLIPLGFAAFFLVILVGPLLGNRRENRPVNGFRVGLRRPRRRAF